MRTRAGDDELNRPIKLRSTQAPLTENRGDVARVSRNGVTRLVIRLHKRDLMNLSHLMLVHRGLRTTGPVLLPLLPVGVAHHRRRGERVSDTQVLAVGERLDVEPLKASDRLADADRTKPSRDGRRGLGNSGQASSGRAENDRQAPLETASLGVTGVGAERRSPRRHEGRENLRLGVGHLTNLEATNRARALENGVLEGVVNGDSRRVGDSRHRPFVHVQGGRVLKEVSQLNDATKRVDRDIDFAGRQGSRRITGGFGKERGGTRQATESVPGSLDALALRNLEHHAGLLDCLVVENFVDQRLKSPSLEIGA